MKSEDVETRAAQVLTECLGEIPFIATAQLRGHQRLGDTEVNILAALKLRDGTVQQILGEVKSSGQPRLARAAVNQLLRYRSVHREAYGVFIAPYISPRAAEICTKDGVGYIDFAGNCRLSFGQVFICREGNRNPFTLRRDLRSLYAPRSTRVLRVLLMRSTEWWRTQALADEAGVSLGQIANVRKLLRDREWIAEGAEGFRLTAPPDLIAEWAESYTHRKNTVRDFYSMKGTDEVEAALAQSCQELDIPYALTGFSGARRVAPSVRGQRVMAYVSVIPQELLTQVGLKEVQSGANVSLMIPYDEGVYYAAKETDALRIVCPVQLYLDLKGHKGRGAEAAEAVLKQVLSKLW